MNIGKIKKSLKINEFLISILIFSLFFPLVNAQQSDGGESKEGAFTITVNQVMFDSAGCEETTTEKGKLEIADIGDHSNFNIEVGWINCENSVAFALASSQVYGIIDHEYQKIKDGGVTGGATVGWSGKANAQLKLSGDVSMTLTPVQGEYGDYVLEGTYWGDLVHSQAIGGYSDVHEGTGEVEGQLEGKFAVYITSEVYPGGWASLNKDRKGDLLKIVKYMKSSADGCTDKNAAKNLDHFADSLLKTNVKYKKEGGKIYKALAGGTPMAHANAWGTVVLYQPFFDKTGTATMNPVGDPQYNKYMAEAASVLIHELTHKDGGRENLAYSNEHDLFKCLGVQSGSGRYNDVNEHLVRLGKGWKTGFDAFDDKWAELQPW